MSLNFESRPHDPPLPSDITLRVPVVYRQKSIYRREGIVISLVSAFAAHLVDWRLRRKDRSRSGASPPVPDWLREDVGLPPAPPKFLDWWTLDRF